MRWFLTDDVPGLDEALRACGQEVVSLPEDHARHYITSASYHPADYPLTALASSRRAEVVVLVRPIRVVALDDGRAEFGYGRGGAKALRNRGVTIAMHADAETLEAYREGKHRTCACQPNDAAVIIATTEAAADIIRGSRRVTIWSPGETAERIVAAVEHARSGRTYSPKKQSREWG